MKKTKNHKNEYIFDNADKAYDMFSTLPNRKMDIKPFNGILNKYVDYIIVKEDGVWYMRIK